MTGCRRSRLVGAWLFVTLLLLAAGERRLADVHYALHVFAISDVGVYDEAVDGDEVTLRLVAMADASPPAVRAPESPLVSVCTPARSRVVAARPIDSPAPRGPPRLPSSIV